MRDLAKEKRSDTKKNEKTIMIEGQEFSIGTKTWFKFSGI